MPLADATYQNLKALYNALEDRVLRPGDQEYLDQLNAQGPNAPVEEIAIEIDWQRAGGVCLFTGQRGTGKSTELLRLQERLKRDGAIVFYADMSEYVSMTKPIEVSDFLISMCGALSDRVEERYAATPGQRGYWERVAHFFMSEVRVDAVGVKFGPGDLKASLRLDPDFKKVIQDKARHHVAKLVQQAHEFAKETVAFAREREGRPDAKVVLLVDSIERLRGLGQEAMAVYESVRDLFVAHADALRIPLLNVVYTIPPYLSVLASGAGALLGGATTHRLVSTHVFKHRSRDVDPAGLDLMRQIVAKRYPAWHKIFSTLALERLAVSSGGDLREFFRLLRACLPAVRDDAQLPLSHAAVERAENDARNEMLPIPTNYLDWLKRIVASHQPCLDDDARLPTLAHFLDNRLVLCYRNGSDWYDVHPLIRHSVDAHEPAAPA